MLPCEGPGNVAGLGDVARIDGYCDATSVRRFQEGHVGFEPVKGLLEVLAEPAFARTPAPRHLGEVEPSCIGEDKFHGLDEEGLKRFA